MEIDSGNLAKGIIGSLVRATLGGAVGWLVSRGLISEEQGTQLIPAVILGVITVVWAVYRKYRIQQRIAKALELPAGSSSAQLDKVVKEPL